MAFKVKDGLVVGANTVIDGNGNVSVPGKLTLANGTTAAASANLGVGTADPSSPLAGDLWYNSGVVKVRNGSAQTKTIAFTDSTITGNAANVTGTVAVANGGTGATTAPAARTALGATTLGSSFFTLANVAAISFPRINADNTISSLSAADFRTAIGAGTSSTVGTVTSVATGTGLTGGTITSTGTISLTGQALAVHNLTTNGFIARTAANTVTARSIAVASSVGLSITNGDGVAGNPTISTNATSANTASALVIRDASGNFSAGIISASLSGNASSASTVSASAAGTGSVTLVNGTMADSDTFRILVGGTATDTGFAEIATGDNGDEPIYVRQYTGSFASPTSTRTATLLDASGNTSFPGVVTATSFTGSLTGNASSVTNGVYTSRSISTSSPLSGGGDLSADRTLSLAANYGDTQNPYGSKTANFVLAAPTGAAGVPTFRALVAADIPSIDAGKITTGALASQRGGTGIDNAGRTLTITGQSFSLVGSLGARTFNTASNVTVSGATTNGRTLTFATGDANRTVTLSGDLTVSNTLTLAGTNGTTMTFPGASTTVAGLGTNQTFSGVNTFTPTARSSGTAAYFTLTTPADTGITASTEAIGVSFTAATRTWATGALSLQRERVFAAPTYAFAAASTITDAVNVDIQTPVAGTNATITNRWALRVGNVNITGGLKLDEAASASAATTYMVQTGADNFVRPKTLANVRSEILNNITLTSNATGFSVAGGTTSKTLTVSNTLTLSGTDASTLNIGNGGTLGSAAFTASNSYQTANNNLTALAGIAVTDGNFIVGNGTTWVAESGTTARSSLGLAIGTDVQAYDAGLQSIAGLTTAADRMIYTTAADVYAVATLTSAGRNLLDDATVADQRTTLGLGSAATVNTGTSGGTIPLLNGTNVWSGVQTVQITSAATNTVTQVARFDSQSSGTPAIGIGVGIEFAAETAAGNTEVGATINAVTTGVTAAAENFDLVFNTMNAGAAANEGFRIKNTGGVTIPTGGTYQINGVSVISGNGLGTSVTSSSLTSVGTITSGTWNGTAIAVAYGGTGTTSSTGTGSVVLGTSPTLTTPTIAQINGSTAASGTLTLSSTTNATKGTVNVGDDNAGTATVRGSAINIKLGTAASAGFLKVAASTGAVSVDTSTYLTSVTPSNFASQTANTFLAAPNGAAGVPTFRTIVAADIPTLNQNTTGTASNVTGTVAIANGGTGATTALAAFNALSPSTTLGDIIYHDGTNDVRLAGNTVSGKRFLTQTGTGTVSAAPGWNAIVDADVPSALTGKTYNALTLTAAATGFTIAGGTTSKTLTVSNTLTLSGTDASTLNIGNGGTLGSAAFTSSGAYAAASHSHTISWTGGTTAGPTLSVAGGTAVAIPSASDTASGVVTTGAQTFAGTKTFNSTITGSISGNAGTVTNGVYTTGSYANPAWITSLAETKVLPSQTTHSGKFLTTNGTSTSWATVTLPAGQTAGSATTGYLTYNGTTFAAGTLYGGTTNPSGTTRLNYGGNLHVNELTAVGNVTAFSDSRLKTDLSKIEDAVAKVQQLTGYTYTRVDSGERHTGLIAQDLEKVLPEAVINNGEYLSVAYGNLVGLLVEAIKELKAEIEELKSK